MTENRVVQKMETIQRIFREVQDSYSETTQLDNYEIEFRSIAYEATSMCIALEDLKNGNELNRWHDFLNENSAHATQIHVGLGWALAQNEISPIEFLQQLEPVFGYRVLDGYGYYEGFFRRRKSILNQQQPQWNDSTATGAYDQGLGRSLWYIHNGEIDAAKHALEKFPVERHKDLWRGLGIAIAYVGGCNEKMLREVFIQSGSYKTQLVGGAMMALVSRDYANYISDDTALVCKIWQNKTPEEIIMLNESLRSGLDLKAKDVYKKWIEEIEKIF